MSLVVKIADLKLFFTFKFQSCQVFYVWCIVYLHLEIFLSSSYLPSSSVGMIHVLDVCHLPRRCYSWTTFLIACFPCFSHATILNCFPLYMTFYSRPGPCNWRGMQHNYTLIIITFFLLFHFKAFLWILLITWHVCGTIEVCSSLVTWP